MIGHPEERQVERLNIPRHCRGGGRGGKTVHLVDLSAAGARIEHGEPLPEWRDLPLDLPRPLGGGQVRAEVVWSHLAGRDRGGESQGGLVYQSGLAFPHSTPAEQAALRVALVRSAGEWVLRLLRDLRRQAKREATAQEQFNGLCTETLGWLGREIESLRFPAAP